MQDQPGPSTSSDTQATRSAAGSKNQARDLQSQLDQVKQQSVLYALSHLKALAASSAPDQSVLVALDMLVDMAQDSSHPDLPLYQNLRAQATRLQDRLCIRGLCLEVLGEKVNDKVSSAVNKLLKEGKAQKPEKGARKEEATSQQAPQPVPTAPTPQYATGMPAPYSQHQFPQAQFPQAQVPYGYQPSAFQAYPHYPNQGGFRSGYRGHGGRQFNRTKAVCHFCGTEGQLVKDCSAIKKLKESQQK